MHVTTRPTPTAPPHLRQQAEELEGVFLNTLMKEMFASAQPKAEGFGGGFAEETWRGLQAEQLAGVLASAGGIGLADSLLAGLLAVQETHQTSAQRPGASP